MAPRELATWTRAMIDSGERLTCPASAGRPSTRLTGGVGDVVPLVPLVAACGAAVPQLSGRGLGHTGGTLDKMESIPGWRATLPAARIVEQLREVGAVICAASESLCPADRKLYALRDVTATVEAIPLIASSIMSKKIAEGTESLVLDVKVGSGAFLPEIDRARRLAETMVELGRAHDVRTVALITDMDAPLGRACGNAPSLRPWRSSTGRARLVEVTLALANEMCRLAGRPPTGPTARRGAGRRAARAGDRMVAAQAATPRRFRRRRSCTRCGRPRAATCTARPPSAWRCGACRLSCKEDPVAVGRRGVSAARRLRRASRCSSTPTTRPGCASPP